ncbi:MAG TPA: hypothetical protein VMT55_03005 [Candidatus Sulfotelmatobacter sp.]|nr:hypothetical protein [Candidatus Sulfotelmatobacter sp.]
MTAQIDQSAVRDRNKLSSTDFGHLNPETQNAVMTAKLNDQILKPAIEQATKLGQQAVAKMRDKFKGDEENSA